MATPEVQSASPPRKCRWYQFSLRTLLLVMSAFGVSSGLVIWAIDPPLSGRVKVRNFTIELPPGSHHRTRRGIDTAVGEIVLGDKRRILRYDIGGLAGNYATNEANGPFKWQKREERNGVRMDYSLVTHEGVNRLIVTFPQISANVWCNVTDDDDVDEVLNVMRTIRPVSP